ISYHNQYSKAITIFKRLLSFIRAFLRLSYHNTSVFQIQQLFNFLLILLIFVALCFDDFYILPRYGGKVNAFYILILYIIKKDRKISIPRSLFILYSFLHNISNSLFLLILFHSLPHFVFITHFLTCFNLAFFFRMFFFRFSFELSAFLLIYITSRDTASLFFFFLRVFYILRQSNQLICVSQNDRKY